MSTSSEAPPLKGQTILVIEEDAGNRTAFTVLLHNAGADVLAVADLDHARAYLTEEASLPDMILLGDVSRGRLDTEKNFCLELKYPAHNHTKRIPVVVVSGLGINPDKSLEDFRRAGVDDIFIKPYAPKELLERLTRLAATIPALKIAGEEREHHGAAASLTIPEAVPAR